MKNKLTLLMVAFAICTFTFVSCDDNSNDDNSGKGGKYIINYGSYSGDKSTISTYDGQLDVVTNAYYKAVNGVDMISNIQYAYQFNGNIYMMGNNADEISYVDEDSFKQTANAIATDDIIKPRYCVGSGDYLYVSCWGGDIWMDINLSYILKLNVKTNQVENKIDLPGGPEGLAIANNKLYAALNYKDSVAVINLENNSISYIATPAVSTYFVKDNNDNLYVSLISSYSKPSMETGLGYINTTTDAIETYSLAGISSSYVNILAPNADFSKLYVMTSAYDENWNLTGAVASFDVASKSFDSDMVVEGLASLNGIAVDGSDLFCFISESTTGNGLAKKYTTDGTFVKDYNTGIAPFMMLTID